MANNVIQIKRSSTTGTPLSLADGELAYSFKSDSKTLFIGDGTSVIAIGGEADHVKLAGIEAGAQVNTVTSVAGKVGAVTLVKADITNFTESDYVHTTGNETIGGNKTFSNDVTVDGNLTVNGTVTHVNSTTVDIGDNILVLNSGATGTPTLDAGIEVNRGTDAAVQLLWKESQGKWGQYVNEVFTPFSLEGHTHVAADITDFGDAVLAYVNGSINLNDLADVDTTTAAENNVLRLVSGQWVASADTFLALDDTPNSYGGADGYFVKVSPDNLLEFSNVVDGGTF